MAHDHGSGEGYGSGYGYGYGSGYGFGFGDYGRIVIGRVGKFEVVQLEPWQYVKVGCEQHLIAYWRANWREIASDNDVVVDIDFEALLDLAEGRQNGD